MCLREVLTRFMKRFGSCWLFVVFAVVVALVPSGAGAQEELSEAKPGPCDDGWVAPTPTDVAVSSVPIRVASTEDDYFVLYVRDKPVVENVVGDIPVLVKRGESGTTILADNLAPLAASRYRVEKYQVANPADLDGDCVDDIAELNALGLRSPIVKIDPVRGDLGAVTIVNRAAFKKLAYKGTNAVSEEDKVNIEYIKFHVCGFDTRYPSFYFQNTNRFKIHLQSWYYEPAVRKGCRGTTVKTGVLVYHPNVVAPDGSLGVYRFDMQQHYKVSFKEVAYMYERLAAVLPFLTNNLAYYPTGGKTWGQQADYLAKKSLYDASRVNVLLGGDVVADVPYVPYHEAEGYGLLKVVEPGEVPGPRDVVVLTALPNNLPRVAGVVTTVPQTPLSHVNLRAIQNDVPNAFIRDALNEDDSDIHELVGEYVYYKTTKDGYTLRAATKAEVDAHYSSSRPASVQTPTRDLTVKQITSLSNISFDDWDAFGVKASNMAELSKLSSLAAGTVPVGYGVPFYFYDEFMKANGLYGDIQALLSDPDFQSDFAEQEKELKKLRKKIKKATTPAWIITALENMHKTYPEGTSLRYRSSTNNEDLPDFSGAGLYDSKTQDPDETTEDGIDKSIKAVWASLWNFRAFAEREHHRVDHLSTAMGVLVHPNFSDELANGVAVSYDPVKGLADLYYVNTQLGEDLVTNPEVNSLPEEILLAADGTSTVLAYSNLAKSNTLFMSDAQMIQLRNSLKAIHDRFAVLYKVKDGDDFAMEIEFKITSANKLAIKQARPWVFTQPLGEAQVSTALAGLISDVWSYAAETDNGEAHVRRWKRVVLALGEDVPGFSGTPMTATEAQGHAQTFSSVRWDPVVEVLQKLEAAAQQAPVTPVVSITADLDVAEGGDALFTVSASPAPSAALGVTVNVAASGDFGVATGSRTVTIPTSGSATLTVATTGDSVDEADGSVTVSVADGAVYDVDSSAGTATVAVTDDDDPPLTVSVVAGSDVTEGGSALFTVSASPAPSAALGVTVNVAASGDFGVATGSRTVTIPTSGSATLTVATTGDTNDEADGSVTVSVNAGTGYTVDSSAGSASVNIADDDDPVLVVYVVPAGLVADVRGYAAETDNGVAHVRRWKRVLLALGEDVPGFSGTPMSATEAQGHAQTFWSVRWDPVVVALQKLEANPSQQQTPVTPTVSVVAGSDVTEGGSALFTVSASPAPSAALGVTVNVAASGDFGVATGSRTVTIPTSGSATLTVATTGDTNDEADGSVTVSVNAGTGYTVDSSAGPASVNIADDDDPVLVVYVVPAGLVADVRGYAAETDNGVAHVRRWKRVLLALGEDVPGFSGTPMSATEAQGHAQTFWSVRWDPVVVALQKLEANPSQQQTPVTPTVSVVAGSDVTEGGSALFTVSASPAPSAALGVTVNVAASGDFGVATGSRTVTIPTSGSATLTVATTGDTNDEADGSVTVTVTDGAAYDVSSTAGSASVNIADDDDPPVPTVSVVAGSDVTEGGSALFTVSASPAPSAALDVTVNVAASGDYGITTGTQTVTIPISGSATLTVATTGDTNDEADGSVTVTVTDGAAYDVSSTAGSASVNIADDDDPPVPTVSVVAGSDVTEGGSALFTVSASPAPSAALDVTVNVAASGDYGITTGTQTVTIPTSGSATLTVATTGDTNDEADGSVTVTVTDGAAYDVSSTAGSATVNIADDDDPPVPLTSSDLPAFQISDGVYNEGNIYGYYLFYVTLNKPVATPVRVRYDFEPTGTGTGHATGGQDYQSISRTIYFRAGVTQNAGLLVVKDDNNKESDETLRITLTSLNPETATTTDRSTATATLTIKDND